MRTPDPIYDAIQSGDRYQLAQALLAERGITEPSLEDVHATLDSIDRIIKLDGSNGANGATTG